jgi:acetyl-CoA carboxylase biotin carboxyl carrier protein
MRVKMEADKIVSIIQSVDRSDLTDAEIKSGDFRISMKKISSPAAVKAVPAVAEKQIIKPEVSEVKEDPSIKTVKSPIVASFLLSPKPDAPLFVEKGYKAKKGSILCILEAMNISNEINAEFDCEVLDICAQSGQMVEYGQILFKLKAL